jgi:LmbE family N-acetylglucosaminyl deacetylase
MGILDYNKYLFVVSHHDDEVLFTGGLLTLLKNKYKEIIVMSAPMTGRHDTNTREKSFINVCNEINAKPIMANFIDCGPHGIKTEEEVDQMKNFIDKFVSDEQIIISHNIIGEYGHNFHKYVNNAVSKLNKNFYCFGYKIDSQKEYIEYDINKKKKLFDFYETFDPMIGYSDIAYEKEEFILI